MGLLPLPLALGPRPATPVSFTQFLGFLPSWRRWFELRATVLSGIDLLVGHYHPGHLEGIPDFPLGARRRPVPRFQGSVPSELPVPGTSRSHAPGRTAGS